MSSGHGVVSHGGIGLAAASISRSTGSPPAADRATTYSRCLRCKPWRGPVAVPHQPLGGETHHVAAPPRSTSATTSEPFQSAGIVACIRNHVVSQAPPHGCPTANGSYVARRGASST